MLHVEYKEEKVMCIVAVTLYSLPLSPFLLYVGSFIERRKTSSSQIFHGTLYIKKLIQHLKAHYEDDGITSHITGQVGLSNSG